MIDYSERNHPYETLFNEGDNKVVFCHECNLFHVYFGTVSLDLVKNSIKGLLGRLQHHLELYEGGFPPNKRCIEIETPCVGIRLLLSINDIKRFQKMLKGGILAYEEGYWKSSPN
ncbi:MAG: hypothetical protein AAF573_07020 [Bacteroidota bacterium]